jgi:TetR/AcrR family transcriptional regulator, cholesterol catabolism regulator
VRRNKEDILATAMAYLGREGVRIPSTKELAEILDISRSSLYYHFPEKGDLLYAILVKSNESFSAAAKQVVDYPLPAPDRLRLMLRAVLALQADLPTSSLPTIFRGEWGILTSEQRAFYVARRDEYEGYFRRLIAEGIKHGEFRKVNVKLTSFAILGMLQAFDGWYDTQGDLTPHEIADAYSDFILGSLSLANPPGPLSGSEFSAIPNMISGSEPETAAEEE